MKILKQFFSVLFVLLCVVGTGYAATFDGVRELVFRRAPWLGKHIQFYCCPLKLFEPKN